jgi:hypothetical protein
MFVHDADGDTHTSVLMNDSRDIHLLTHTHIENTRSLHAAYRRTTSSVRKYCCSQTFLSIGISFSNLTAACCFDIMWRDDLRARAQCVCVIACQSELRRRQLQLYRGTL